MYVLCILFLTTNFYHRAYSVPSLKSECQTDSSREFKWSIGKDRERKDRECHCEVREDQGTTKNTTHKVPLTTLFYFLKHNKYMPPSLGVKNCKGHK